MSGRSGIKSSKQETPTTILTSDFGVSTAKKVWDKLFRPPCWGKYPWDHDAQDSGRCNTCEKAKECFKEIKRKEKENTRKYKESMGETFQTAMLR